MRSWNRGRSFGSAMVVLLWALALAAPVAGQIVTSDQADYLPGATVVIEGAGFGQNELLLLEVVRIDAAASTSPEQTPWQVQAEPDGTFLADWFARFDWIGATVEVTATGLATSLAATTRFTVTAGDFSGLDLTAAEPTSYTHGTGGGAYDDRTLNVDIVESLEGGDFACGDLVTFLFQIEVDANPVNANQTVQLSFKFDSNPTGQPGVGYVDVVNAQVNYSPIEDLLEADTNEDGISDDGGSVVVITNESFDPPGSAPFGAGGAPVADAILLTITLDDLEAGETLVVRIDVRLACDPDEIHPTGNVQARLTDARLIIADGQPVNQALSGAGNMTISLMSPGNTTPTGACCLQGGRCVITTEDDCENVQDGNYQGDGMDCDPNPCPQPPATGACCLAGGACQVLAASECAGAGGSYQGDGTACTANPCPQPPGPGACCLAGGVCQVQTGAECNTAGGDFQGAGTNCKEADCPESGACCFCDRSCVAAEENDCITTGGVFRGAGTSCGDPCPAFPIPGRPADDGTGDRVLRGYIVAWAVNGAGEEISWNHLSGGATLVNYRDQTARAYNAYAFQAVDGGASSGESTGTPGELWLDGSEYVSAFDELLLDFYAVDSGALTGALPNGLISAETVLTLHTVSVDLRQETEGPVCTKAHFDIWNMNEVKFSGTHRCICCWDQTALRDYGVPNHFHFGFLQTDKGRARIDGQQSQVCDPGTEDAALLGIVNRFLDFDYGARRAATANVLGGVGMQTAVMRYDVEGLPPAAHGGETADWRDHAPQGLGGSAPNTVMASGMQLMERVSTTDKGSLLIFSQVELRWNAQGGIVQDTFIDLVNDYPADVEVQMYFINGDAPLAPSGGECAHPGWNRVDNRINLTKNEPTYWSVLTGMPKGVSPLQVLDLPAGP